MKYFQNDKVRFSIESRIEKEGYIIIWNEKEIHRKGIIVPLNDKHILKLIIWNIDSLIVKGISFDEIYDLINLLMSSIIQLSANERG
jgi:hypothetical protein